MCSRNIRILFRSREDHRPKKSLRRCLKELGIQFGGWHDFRHSLSTMMAGNKVHPKVISGTLGHVKVEFTPQVYDHASVG